MKEEKVVKNSTRDSTEQKYFYFSQIISGLRVSTDLSKLIKTLYISKQKLNYYIGKLVKDGFLIHKGRGWYEVVKVVKNSTSHDINKVKDSIRGHAYVWDIGFKKIPENWNKRIDLLIKKNIHYKLVCGKVCVPRIKVLGRKVWLCNNSIRVYDKKDNSYYGENAIKSKYKALLEILLIVDTLERKLGILLDRIDIKFKKEHYALIKNDLAIEENRKGNIIRVSDDSGEWLLIDDSLEQGGELENVGKLAYQTNIPMQKWWNDNKETNFKVTPNFILNGFNNLIKDIEFNAENFKSHVMAVRELGNNAKANTIATELLAEKLSELIEEVKKK
jgi:hypothetical protein